MLPQRVVEKGQIIINKKKRNEPNNGTKTKFKMKEMVDIYKNYLIRKTIEGCEKYTEERKEVKTITKKAREE